MTVQSSLGRGGGCGRGLCLPSSPCPQFHPFLLFGGGFWESRSPLAMSPPCKAAYQPALVRGRPQGRPPCPPKPTLLATHNRHVRTGACSGPTVQSTSSSSGWQAGSPGTSPVGCRPGRAVSTQIQVTNWGGVLSGKTGALKCTELELGVPENNDQSLEPEGASGNVPDTLCPGALVRRLLLS